MRLNSVEEWNDPSFIPTTSLEVGHFGGDILDDNVKERSRRRPEWYVRRFASQRWRKYLMELRTVDNHKFRLEYGRYLCRIWNGPGYVEEEEDIGQLLGFELYFYQEPLIYTPIDKPTESTDDDDDKVEHETILLWNHTCF
jgi:hypothetical protein